VSTTIEAVGPATIGPVEAPHAAEPLSGAGFAAALRDFTEMDETKGGRFARLNAMLRTDRPAYPDLKGCRSWLVW
jgi:hypothetical protein